ncbi:MAG TPA: sigma-70 family RNA polymerase sigma factor [Planctomycetota bacterium]|nr:sigma-70 family RNA polymerase sigma factor [Planctomycetota bacterium]
MSEGPEPREAPFDAAAEEALVRRAQAGDRDAFRSLYQAYQDRVFATAYRIAGDRETAADLAQEVFVKVFEELPGFRFGSRFSTWLYRVAANHAINKASETARHARLNERVAREKPSVAPAAPAARDRFADERVQAALGGLSVKLRVVTVLRYLEGLSYEEIAEALDLSVGTVKSRLFLAHATLKEALNDLVKDVGP